jgi:hypothetical protein
MAETDTELEVAIVRRFAIAVQRVDDFRRDDATHLRDGPLAPRVLARSHVVTNTNALADLESAIAVASRIHGVGFVSSVPVDISSASASSAARSGCTTADLASTALRRATDEASASRAK